MLKNSSHLNPRSKSVIGRGKIHLFPPITAVMRIRIFKDLDLDLTSAKNKDPDVRPVHHFLLLLKKGIYIVGKGLIGLNHYF